MDKKEFESCYASRSGLTLDRLHQLGGRAEVCECGLDECRGWQMVFPQYGFRPDLPPFGYNELVASVARIANSRDEVSLFRCSGDVWQEQPESVVVEELPEDQHRYDAEYRAAKSLIQKEGKSLFPPAINHFGNAIVGVCWGSGCVSLCLFRVMIHIKRQRNENDSQQRERRLRILGWSVKAVRVTRVMRSR